jgi:hypothetical protein
MLYLVTSNNTRNVSSLVAAETERVNELRAAGVIRNGWVKSDFSGAFLLLDCANEAEAYAALNTLPTVVSDATTFVLSEVVDLDSLG